MIFSQQSDNDTKEDDEANQPEDDDDELQIIDMDSPPSAEEDNENAPFSIVLTTYEMITRTMYIWHIKLSFFSPIKFSKANTQLFLE